MGVLAALDVRPQYVGDYPHDYRATQRQKTADPKKAAKRKSQRRARKINRQS
jgi:hypothetical protein